MKKLMLLMVAMAMYIAASAQQLYELKYYDKGDNLTYECLFFLTSEEECFITAVSDEPDPDTGEPYCWMTDYVLDCDTDDDGDRYIAFLPMEDYSEEGALYPTFMQFYDKKGDFDGPACVVFEPISALKMRRSNIKTCEYFKEVDIREKDSDFFLKFFDEDDEWYERLMEAKESLDEQSYDANNEETNPGELSNGDVTMHFVLAAATFDKTIGESVETDVELVRKVFRAMSKQMGIGFDESVIEGRDFSRRNIENAIKNLKVAPNDIVVFIYSGHGFRFDDDTDPYPRMFLTYGSDLDEDLQWSTTDAFNALASKKARLTLFLSDCCNSEVGITRAEMESMAFGTRAINNNIDSKKLCQLFLEQSGTLRATAAKAGQYALCDKSGGFLITSFLNNIKSQVSALYKETPSWALIMENASNAVAKKTSNQIDEAGNAVEPQTVVKALKLFNIDGYEVSEQPSERSSFLNEKLKEGKDKMKQEDTALDVAISISCVAIPVAILIVIIILIVRLLKKKKN